MVGGAERAWGGGGKGYNKSLKFSSSILLSIEICYSIENVSTFWPFLLGHNFVIYTVCSVACHPFAFNCITYLAIISFTTSVSTNYTAYSIVWKSEVFRGATFPFTVSFTCRRQRVPVEGEREQRKRMVEKKISNQTFISKTFQNAQCKQKRTHDTHVKVLTHI